MCTMHRKKGGQEAKRPYTTCLLVANLSRPVPGPPRAGLYFFLFLLEPALLGWNTSSSSFGGLCVKLVDMAISESLTVLASES